jgi:hypothetical protein
MTQKCTAESKQKGIEAEKMFQKWLDRQKLPYLYKYSIL